MLNADAADVPQTSLGVVDYVDPVVAAQMANGRMNTAEPDVVAHITSAIRRGLPQMKTGPARHERVCLVGSGPSLADTETELRDLIWDGAILVTLNGSYHWCREHNLQPKTQIVMDARATNARFVQPYVPKCNYVLASQCHPDVFDAVADYPHTWIFHPVIKKEGATSAVLDDYYGGNWIGVGGGTTVATRAIFLLRMAGYLRFDLFGIDCCWRGEAHHAFPQPENDRDNRATVRMTVKGHPDTREFVTSAWHCKQLEDMLTTFKINGTHFSVNVHGDGMLAHALRVLGDAAVDDLSLTESHA